MTPEDYWALAFLWGLLGLLMTGPGLVLCYTRTTFRKGGAVYWSWVTFLWLIGALLMPILFPLMLLSGSQS